MPGAYAHITMAYTNAKQDILENSGIPDPLIGDLLIHEPYFELGAVGPDMPYLVGLGKNTNANRWADVMHYQATGVRWRAGVDAVRACVPAARPKTLAWLLGFVEHIVMDMVIHPIVNLRVGGVYGPRTEKLHRECEMHQDVHIVERQLHIESLPAGKIISTGIEILHRSSDHDEIDPDIKNVWNTMLAQSSPEEHQTNPPEIDRWYDSFKDILKMAEHADGLVNLARHIGFGGGYPNPAKVNRSYTQKLTKPDGTSLTYEGLFEMARIAVLDFWAKTARAVLSGNNTELAGIGDWNLDSGRSATPLIFWT